MAHQPPVPPQQQSDIIRGASSPPSRDSDVKHDPAGGTAGVNTDEQGQAGNRHQNLNHAPGQQDR